MTNENKIEIERLKAENERLRAENEDLSTARIGFRVLRDENKELKAEVERLKIKYEFGLEIAAEGTVDKDDIRIKTIVVRFNEAAMDWRKRIMNTDDPHERQNKFHEFDRRTAEYLEYDIDRNYFALMQTYNDIFTAVIVFDR